MFKVLHTFLLANVIIKWIGFDIKTSLQELYYYNDLWEYVAIYNLCIFKHTVIATNNFINQIWIDKQHYRKCWTVVVTTTCVSILVNNYNQDLLKRLSQCTSDSLAVQWPPTLDMVNSWSLLNHPRLEVHGPNYWPVQLFQAVWNKTLFYLLNRVRIRTKLL